MLHGADRAYSNLGSAYIRLHSYADAVPVMEKAVALAPSNDVYWRNLGDAYQLAPGLSSKAPAAYQHAADLAEEEIKVNPRDSTSLSDAALYWAKLGQFVRARKEISRAVELAPTDNDVLFTSALVYELSGDRPRALTAIKAAYKAGYALEDIQNAPELTRLRNDAEYSLWLKHSVR